MSANILPGFSSAASNPSTAAGSTSTPAIGKPSSTAGKSASSTTDSAGLSSTRDVKWFLACRIEDIPPDGGACVSHGDDQIAIFHFSRRGQWYATQNLCPHKQQMALSRGMTGSAGEQCEPKVACPFHKRTFSLLTGECLNDENYQIRTYPVKVKEGRVYIGV